MIESENYMDQFETPEQFIRHEITANRGTQNVVDKKGLLELCEEHGIKAAKTMTKENLFDLLKETMSLEDIAACCNIGGSSKSMQIKFDISHDKVKRMARLGYIKVTGNHKVWLFGKCRYADTYSVFDYYRLTKEEIHEWLKANPKGTRKAKVITDDEGRNRIFSNSRSR